MRRLRCVVRSALLRAPTALRRGVGTPVTADGADRQG
jgi:hypothetical protein